MEKIWRILSLKKEIKMVSMSILETDAFILQRFKMLDLIETDRWPSLVLTESKKNQKQI